MSKVIQKMNMTNYFQSCMLIVILLFLRINSAISQEVQGDTTTVEGIKVLRVWGTHGERGYAHGYLMAPQLMTFFTDFILEVVLSGEPFLLYGARTAFTSLFNVEQKYWNEADGIIRGMKDAGVDIYHSLLDRKLDALDVLTMNTLEIGSLFGIPEPQCSSLSSWGTSTENDSILNGDLVIMRFNDSYTHPIVIASQVLIVHIPSEEEEQPWIGVDFCGAIGTGSAVNETGISAFINSGQYGDYVGNTPCHPYAITIRNGIETRDYNNDGYSTSLDVADAFSDKFHLAPQIIHSAGPAAFTPCAVVVECNNELGSVYRDVNNNTLIPGDNLAATNDFRLLSEETGYCYRYSKIADALIADPNITAEKSWQLLSDAAGRSVNLLAIQFIPSQRQLKVSIADTITPAYLRTPVCFNTDTLFHFPTIVEMDDMSGISLPENLILVQAYPNPFNGSTTLQIKLHEKTFVNLKIYNLKGQEIADLYSGYLNQGAHTLKWTTQIVPTGLYICRTLWWTVESKQYGTQSMKLCYTR